MYIRAVFRHHIYQHSERTRREILPRHRKRFNSKLYRYNEGQLLRLALGSNDQFLFCTIAISSIVGSNRSIVLEYLHFVENQLNTDQRCSQLKSILFKKCVCMYSTQNYMPINNWGLDRSKLRYVYYLYNSYKNNDLTYNQFQYKLR